MGYLRKCVKRRRGASLAKEPHDHLLGTCKAHLLHMPERDLCTKTSISPSCF
jgi:hypothetical protein